MGQLSPSEYLEIANEPDRDKDTQSWPRVPGDLSFSSVFLKKMQENPTNIYEHPKDIYEHPKKI